MTRLSLLATPATSNQQQTTNPMPQLIDTISDILALSGAAVERNQDHLEALLPAETARDLHLPEHAVLAFEAQTNGAAGELVTYQSELVDRLFDWMQQKGLYAQISVADLYLKHGVTAVAESRFTVLNGLLKAAAAVERRLQYACFHFKYTAISDEKKEGLARTVINEHTLAEVHEMMAQLSLAVTSEAESVVSLETQPLAKVYHAACRHVRPIISGDLADFHRSLQRRLQRDITRLREYYQSLNDEIQNKIVRRQLAGKEREDEEARLRAVDLEYRRKVADQREKYAMKIEVEPINLLRINTTAMMVTAELRCRKLGREVSLVWNPLLKDFEPIPCESCGDGLFAMQLCEEKLHLLCRACSHCPGCKRAICHRCHPGKCPKCGAVFQQI